MATTEEKKKIVGIRECGKSGLKLPVVGVGCWSWGGGKDSYWGNQEQKDVDDVIKAAIKCGCNFFDTAEAYNDGNSEIQLGKALKKSGDDFIVGSKVLPENCTPEGLRKSLKNTLTRLGTDSIDLYMVHWPLTKQTMGDAYSETAVADCFKTLAEIQEEGLIKYIGISNFGPKQLTEALKTGVKIAVNQLVYNLLSRAIEDEILPMCAENGIGIIAYSPLMQGLLTDKFKSLSEISDYRLRTRHFSGTRSKSRHGEKGHEDLVWKTVLEIRKIAANAKIDTAAMCIAWTIANPNITCVIPGNRNAKQMETNAKAVTMELSEDIISALNKATEKLKEAMGPHLDIYENVKKQRSY